MQCLPRDRQLLERVLSHLAQEEIANESSRQHSERENAWHELLSSNCLAEISSDEEQLQLAERARCYCVVEYLLEKLERYDTILDCYIRNEARHETMFAYMERHVATPERYIYRQLRRHLKELIKINAKETTRILALHYPEKINELLDLLRREEALLYVFLKCLNDRRSELEASQLELLFELYCKMESAAVVQEFLVCNSGYRLDKAIAIAESHHLNRSVIYLYEMQESYAKAFDLSMDLLKSAAGEEAAKEAQEICALLGRSVTTLPAQELERCWFVLLQYILPLQELQSITKSLLHEASQHIDLHNLVQLIMNTHNVSSSFGDIKDLLMGMLDSSRHQTEGLRHSAGMLCQSLHLQFAERFRHARRGLWVTTTKCSVCRQRLYDHSQVLILGGCGHGLHEECMEEAETQFEECPRCFTNIPDQSLVLPRPSRNLISISSSLEMGALQLKAPPRRFT